MKRVLSAVCAVVMSANVAAQCNPYGWVLVDQKMISTSERLCVYEKNGARVSLMVSTPYCPRDPC